MSSTLRRSTKASLRLRTSCEPIKISRTKPFVIHKAPMQSKAPAKPLTIKRPQNTVIRKIPSPPRSPLEPSIKAQLPVTISHYPSSPLYPVPTRATSDFWKTVRSSLAPVEDVPAPNRDNETPREGVERALASANAKRIDREAWFARTAGTTLAISLLLSPRSRANISKLRKKYDTQWETPRAITNVLRRLEVEKYAEYENMLSRFTQMWKPFVVRLKPGRLKQKGKFKVGLQLESNILGLLVKDLQKDVRKIHSRIEACRMVRSSEQLSMIVIHTNIRGFEDAVRLEELLKRDDEGWLEDLQVDGLILHGRQGNLDFLFPAPKEFRFPGG